METIITCYTIFKFLIEKNKLNSSNWVAKHVYFIYKKTHPLEYSISGLRWVKKHFFWKKYIKWTILLQSETISSIWSSTKYSDVISSITNWVYWNYKWTQKFLLMLVLVLYWPIWIIISSKTIFIWYTTE